MPPSEKLVRALKKNPDIDNPWAVANWIKGRENKKKKKKEVIGTGSLQAILRDMAKEESNCIVENVVRGINKCLEFNPNHDDLGKFSSVDSSGLGKGEQELSNDEFEAHYMKTISTKIKEPGIENGIKLYQGNADENTDTITGHELINEVLRGNYTPNAEENIRVENSVKALDKAIENSPELPRDAVLYRGINPAGMNYSSPEDLVGKSIEDLGYMSTSSSGSIADRFVRDSDGILLEIQVPKGTKALAIDAYTDRQPFSAEQELVLSRGSSLFVQEYRYDSAIGRHILGVRYEPL